MPSSLCNRLSFRRRQRSNLTTAMEQPPQQQHARSRVSFIYSIYSSTTFLFLLFMFSPMDTHGFFAPMTKHTPVDRRCKNHRASIGLISSFSSLSAVSSLRPAAEPLMDSGKALARSGELLIDATTDMDLYGGALSAAGAQLRNAGDCVAQAAASMRFKTATELVSDELREAATCLLEGVDKLQLAMEEAQTDNMSQLASQLLESMLPTKECGVALEAAGAAMLQQQPAATTVQNIGKQLVSAGESLGQLSKILVDLPAEGSNAALSSQRLKFAGEKMIQAGNNLQGIKSQAKGKGWLKGGTP